MRAAFANPLQVFDESYVDDLLLFADDKAELWEWQRATNERLARLRLVFHPGAHPRPVTEGIPFLDFVVYPDRMPLKRRKVVDYRRRLRSLVQQGDWDAIQASYAGWEGHARVGSTTALRRSMECTLPERLARIYDN